MRIGEKSAAEISDLFAQSSANDDWVPKQSPFSNFFQHQRKPKSTVLDQSKTAKSTSRQTESFDFSDASYNPNRGKNRDSKMIDDNSVNSTNIDKGMLENGKLENNYIANLTVKSNEFGNKSAILDNQFEYSIFNEEDQVAEESIVSLQSELTKKGNENLNNFKNVPGHDRSINTSESKVKFDIKEHNIDDIGHTWRPMKIDSSGDIISSRSMLLDLNGKMINLTSRSDSWTPNSGPILKERDK